MSTRSTIWYKQGKEYKGIYCQSDGYLEWVGLLLYTFYNTEDKVKELISFGDMSSLGIRLGEKVDFNKRYMDMDYYNTTRDQCIFYHRDKGEPKRIASLNATAFNATYKNGLPYYNYIWINNAWHVFYRERGTNSKPQLKLLSDELRTIPTTEMYKFKDSVNQTELNQIKEVEQTVLISKIIESRLINGSYAVRNTLTGKVSKCTESEIIKNIKSGVLYGKNYGHRVSPLKLTKYGDINIMSTGGAILRKLPDGSYEGIYSNNDSSFARMGAILEVCYKDSDKVEDLINLGNLKDLGKEIGYKIEPNMQIKDCAQCISYTRDEGKNSPKFKIAENQFETFVHTEQDKVVSDVYVYANNRWYLAVIDFNDNLSMRALADVIDEEYLDEYRPKKPKTKKEVISKVDGNVDFIVLRKERDNYIIYDTKLKTQKVVNKRDIQTLITSGFKVGKKYGDTVRAFSV